MQRHRLSPAGKGVYALGDFTLNTVLAALSLIYASYFLTQVAGLRPALAGLVPLIGRAVDAFTDPLMGRISDVTRWRGGRRRPYLLLGAVPYGISFALLWYGPPFTSQAALFGYYTLVYCGLAVSMTVLSIPYLALLPEMALDYDERTSLNAYRNAGSVAGIFAAICIRPLAESFGGGMWGYTLTGCIGGVVVALPWLAVYRVTFERPEFRRPVAVDLREGLRSVMRHRTFLKLMGLYLSGRIAMDLIGALMILYVTYWIGRSEDFEIIMTVFLLSVVAALPFWLRLSRSSDKGPIFVAGASWWMVMGLLFLFAPPGCPRWILCSLAALAGLGYAVADLMPWAMLGEVIDEDDLASGERREGLYNGIFTFLRKLGGATGVFVVLTLLDWLGFEQGAQQSETTRQAIRWMTALAPTLFLALAVWLARDYPLTRVRHQRILADLAARQGSSHD